MKRFALATVLVLSLGLVACNKERNREPVNIGGRPGSQGPNGPYGPRGPLPTSTGQIEWGEVTDANLNANVRDFVGQNTQIGNIGGPQTGVFFQGQVSLANNMPLYQVLQSGQQAQVMQQGRLNLEIWDDMVGSPDGAGGVLPQIVISLMQVRGGASAQGADLIFEDQYGSITLRGSFSGQIYQGQMTYNNGYGDRVLGQFHVPMCGLFRCQ